MRKFKCTFTPGDILRILQVIQDHIQILQYKQPHELSETMVYRLYNLVALEKKFKNRSTFMHPTDTFKMSFDLKDVLTLKFVLLDKMRTSGLSDIFIKLDRYIHPAIQLEMV